MKNANWLPRLSRTICCASKVLVPKDYFSDVFCFDNE